MSNLDRPLGDLIKANKQAKKGGAGAGRQGGIAKGAGRQGASKKKAVPTRGGRQQSAQGKQQQNGNGAQRNAKPKQNKPRQQAKATPVAAMRAQGKAQSRSTTANRQSTGRTQQLARARSQAAVGTMLVTTLPNGQVTQQPVALVQQPGQAGAQVVALAAPQRTNQPLFKVQNIKARQSGQQQQGGNRQRQSGGGNRQAANGQGRRRN